MHKSSSGWSYCLKSVLPDSSLFTSCECECMCLNIVSPVNPSSHLTSLHPLTVIPAYLTTVVFFIESSRIVHWWGYLTFRKRKIHIFSKKWECMILAHYVKIDKIFFIMQSVTLIFYCFLLNHLHLRSLSLYVFRYIVLVSINSFPLW